MTSEDDMTYDEWCARFADGIPAQIVPGPRPISVHEPDWQAEAAVWGDETREWTEGVTRDSDPDSDA